MKFRSLLITVAAMLLLGACTLNRPVCATSNPVGSKVGIFAQKGILFFPPVSNTDAAILKAAANGGITKISTIDHNITYFLFFNESRTIVSGE